MRTTHEDEYVAYVSARMLWLRRLAFLLCHDWHRADDLAQATLTNLYVHWRRARAANDIDAYVRVMLVRAYLGERRSAWSRHVTVRDSVPEVAEPSTDRTLTLGVERALATLAPRQRATIVLRYFCDMSVDEAATALGCSTGTVKSQTAKAFDTLRVALHREGIEPAYPQPQVMRIHHDAPTAPGSATAPSGVTAAEARRERTSTGKNEP